MMKVAILVLSIVLACQAITDEEVAEQWKSFQEQNGKTYKSPAEATKRLSIFKQNLVEIEAHNKLYDEGKVTYQKGVTPFTDLTPQEFSEYVNKFKVPNFKRSGKPFEANPNYTAPLKTDWRNQGAVTYVKNQGQCGSCWSFSATGGLEGQSYIRNGQALVLSEQNLVDCAGSQYNCFGCNGGFMDGAFEYVSQYGIDSEKNYPYQAAQGYCSPRSVVLRSSSYQDVARDENSLQQAVAQIGPISIGIDATNELQNYRSGVLIDQTCSDQINHGVLAVGYGNDGGYDYWIIKNSWGANWGEAGYFKLVKGYQACGVTSMASYPIL